MRTFIGILVASLLASAWATTFDIVSPSEARYRVREQLLGVSFPSDAVGVTSGVAGSIAFDDAGIVLPGSRVTIDLAALRSDQARRDGFLRTSTLQTASYPTAVLVPTVVTGHAFPLPTTGTVPVTIRGDLTIRDVTVAVVWTGTATFDGDTVRLQAETALTFADLRLTKPRVASVLSVDDIIRLEVDAVFRRRD